MPPVKARLKSGWSGTVEAPEGASDADIIRLAKEQEQRGDFEVVPEGTPGVRIIKPSVSGYLAEGVKRRAGDIGAMIGATAVPGAGFLPFAGRVLASEGTKDLVDWATGEQVTPGVGAGSQLFGEGVSKVVRPLLSPTTYKAFATRTANALAEALDKEVPAWRQFAASAKGLYERAHGTGQRLLSQTFETAMRQLKRAIPETMIVHVPERIETAGVVDMISKPRNARALIDELPALRKSGGAPYRSALKALSEGLPDGVSPELDAARREYKVGSGWIEFAEKGKFLSGERYDPATAQKALDRFGKKLLGRGMDEIVQIIRGPGAKPIEIRPHGILERRIGGLLAGEAIGYPAGHPYLGPAVGLGAMELLPATTYRNVPATRLQRFTGRLGTAGLAEGAREISRQLGITEKLPGGP